MPICGSRVWMPLAGRTVAVRVKGTPTEMELPEVGATLVTVVVVFAGVTVVVAVGAVPEK